MEKCRSFTKKRALGIVFVCVAVLVAIILLRWHTAAHNDLSTTEGREMFLFELGWEIDRASEQHKSVVIPEILAGVMDEYNRMQLDQGYDLSAHLGERCEQYTYTVTNYPDCEGTVLVVLYVQGRSIIAGDIHTTSIDGFMHGILRSRK